MFDIPHPLLSPSSAKSPTKTVPCTTSGPSSSRKEAEASSHDNPFTDPLSYSSSDRPASLCSKGTTHEDGRNILPFVNRFIEKYRSSSETKSLSYLETAGARCYKGRSVDGVYCRQKDRLDGGDDGSACAGDEAIENGFEELEGVHLGEKAR